MTAASAPAALKRNANPLEHVPLSKIAVEDGHNPRTRKVDEGDAFAELVASIEHHGVLQPILLRHHVAEKHYVVVAGHRRLAAAAKVGLETIPAMIGDLANDPEGAFAAAVVENISRDDLNPVEQAHAIQRLIDAGKTQAEVAKMLGRSERSVRERLRILKLPAKAREGIADGSIPSTVARVLEQIAGPTPALAEKLIDDIASGELRAGELLDDDMRADALHERTHPPYRHDDAHEQVTAVRLHQNVGYHPMNLPIDPEKAAALATKLTDAGAQPRLHFGDDAELREQAAAGEKLLVLSHPGYGGEMVHDAYVADADLLTAAAERATDAAIAAHAKGKADQAKAAKQAAKTKRTPAEIRRAEHQAAAKALEDKAVDYAMAMNPEVAEWADGLDIDDPLIRELEYRALTASSGWRAIAFLAEQLAHPTLDHIKSSLQNALYSDATRRKFAEMRAPSYRPRFLHGLVAGALVDQRVLKSSARLQTHHYLEAADRTLVLAIAHKHNAPARAIALMDARLAYERVSAEYALDAPRRRILQEVGAGGKQGPLEPDLRKACETYKWGPPHGKDLVDGGAERVSKEAFVEALQACLDAGHLAKHETERAKGDDAGQIDTRYTLTADGKAALEGPPATEPLLADIDPDAGPGPGEVTPPRPPQKVLDALADHFGGKDGMTTEQLQKRIGERAWFAARGDKGNGGAKAIVKRLAPLITEPEPKPAAKAKPAAKPKAKPAAAGPNIDKALSKAAAELSAKAKAEAKPAKPLKDRALAMVKASPGITIPEMAEALSVNQNTLYRVLPELAKQKLVTKSGRGWHERKEA